MSAIVMNTANEKKNAEIKMRTTKSAKQVVTLAADALGLSVTDFIMQQSLARAKAVLEEKGVMVLEDADRAAFVSALITPPEPSARLKALVAEYEKQPVE